MSQREWDGLLSVNPMRQCATARLLRKQGTGIGATPPDPGARDVRLGAKAGTISSAQLLRRLGSHSRRNRQYQAFRELGSVVRTVFLLEFLSDAKLREQITATTNKVEATTASPSG